MTNTSLYTEATKKISRAFYIMCLFFQSHVYQFLPTLVFGIMSAMSGLLVLTLPETNKQKLPDSLKEAQDQDRKIDAHENETVENKTRL